MAYAARVVHLGPLRASGRLWAVRAMAAAALRGGARRHARVRVVLGYFLGVKEFVCVCKANASQNKSHGMTVLCCSDPAMAKLRRGGAPAVMFLPLGWPMCQGI